MHKTIVKRYVAPGFTSLPNRQLALLAALFIIGAVLGTCAASPITSGTAQNALAGVLGGEANLCQTFLAISKYHLMVLILGLAAFGSFVLPVFALVKGFTLSFTAACLKMFFSVSSFQLCFLAFVAVELISTAVLLLMIVSSFRTSSRMTRILFGGRDSFNSVFTREHFTIVLISFVILFLLALAYKFLFWDHMSGLLLM